MAERRNAPRAPIKVQMEGRKNGDVFTGLSVNISETGVLIETGKKLDPGQNVTIHMILPNNEEITGTGVVIRNESWGFGKFGIAVHWDLATDDRDRIAGIIQDSIK